MKIAFQICHHLASIHKTNFKKIIDLASSASSSIACSSAWSIVATATATQRTHSQRELARRRARAARSSIRGLLDAALDDAELADAMVQEEVWMRRDDVPGSNVPPNAFGQWPELAAWAAARAAEICLRSGLKRLTYIESSTPEPVAVDDTATTMEEEPLVQPQPSMCIDSPPPECKRAPLEELFLPSAKRLRAYY